jgi:hypothetical protein
MDDTHELLDQQFIAQSNSMPFSMTRKTKNGVEEL